jgi:ubiquinone/menaquinone biosynthesis C-methylase UbiE
MAKDLFSDHSEIYAKYRPTYPQELFDYVLSFVRERNRAWDCATGNGQAAKMLADYFNRVDATDISEEQLKNAVQKPNIFYQLCPAEHTPFEDRSFDLITIATAYHWLNWTEFHREATRVGKPGAVIAAWGYNTLRCADERVNRIIQHFYKDVVASYWDPERRHVDESYENIPFDFDPLPSRRFERTLTWNKDAFKGYLLSWSAVQTYIRRHGSSPIDLIGNDLNEVWSDQEEKEVHFPIFLKIGRIRP